MEAPVEITSLFRDELEILGLAGKAKVYVKEVGEFFAQSDKLGDLYVVYIDPSVLKSRKRRKYAKYIVRHELIHLSDILQGKYDFSIKKTGVDLLDDYSKALYLAYTDMIADRQYSLIFDSNDIPVTLDLSYERAKNIVKQEISWDSFFKSLKYVVSCLLYDERRVKRSKVLGRLYDLYTVVYRDLRTVENLDWEWSSKARLIVLEALAIISLIDLDKSFKEKRVVTIDRWSDFLVTAEQLELVYSENPLLRAWVLRLPE